MNRGSLRAAILLAGGVLLTAVGYTVGAGGWFGRQADGLQTGGLAPSLFTESQKSTTKDVSDDISNSRKNAITKTVEAASGAIVGINVTEVREFQDPWGNIFGDDPFFRNFLPRYRQEVRGLGSGFLISSDGYIITNDHVAGNAKEITVTMTNGEKYKAELIGSDMVSDVALLKVNGKDFPFLQLGNSDHIMIGEWAVAFGNPFGLFENTDKPIVTVGVISAKGMNLNVNDNRSYRGLIQTDAVINSGNSGGPLLDADGEVIGMNTLIFTGGVSQAYIGYGFAIPINRVKGIVNELRTKGKVERDFWTGMEIQAVDRRIARYFNLPKTEGVIVSDVKQSSPAEKAGLKVGDIITEVNGEKITNEDVMVAIVHESRSGDILSLKVFRDKQYFDYKLTLEKRKR